MNVVEKLKAKYEWPYLKLSTDPKAEFLLTELAYFQYVGRRPGVTGDQLWAGALATQFLEQFEVRGGIHYHKCNLFSLNKNLTDWIQRDSE